ncbi:MAG: hypothetical protein IIW05_01330 [Paludibacteraceae bacterium]|nr:hypothetical protein [Bacteroidaceae bacterium]MBQ5774490.1 hypothetical protein [Paludibacteraceae bacterium]
MKKVFYLMLVLSAITMSFSCSKDDDTFENPNPLKGTLWYVEDEVTVFEKNEFTRYIEFVDNTTVKIWDTDGHGPYNGTYTINGNKVIFNNLHDRYWDRYYISATYTSRSLTVAFSYDKQHETGPYYDTYTKEQ